MNRQELERELEELEAKNASAPRWGAAVGARHERIKEIVRLLGRPDDTYRDPPLDEYVASAGYEVGSNEIKKQK